MGGDRYVEAFRQLSMKAHDAGLMRRRYGFYWTMLLVCTTATVAILVGVVLLGATWFQLILAALLGIVMAQLGFLGHEAAHQQIFISRGWNEWVSRVLAGLFTGLSYGWWVDKHSRHHANPNKERADPDADEKDLRPAEPHVLAGEDRPERVRVQGEALEKEQRQEVVALIAAERGRESGALVGASRGE